MNIELTSRKSLTEVTEWYGFAVRIQMPSDAKDTTQNSPELKNIFNKLKKRKKKPVGKRRMEAVRILKVSENNNKNNKKQSVSFIFTIQKRTATQLFI